VNEVSGNQGPILLMGMPRSGTTWLGKIFDSHPRVLYRHEPDSWQRIQVPIIMAGDERCRYETLFREYVKTLPSMRADRVCGKRPLFAKDYVSPWVVRRYAVASALHKALARIGFETAAPRPPLPGGENAYRLVWKSIESLGRLGLLLDSLPEARSVHIVRHPCGYVASVLRGEAAARFAHNSAADDLLIYEMLVRTNPARRRGLTMRHFESMTAVERLAWRWVIFNEVAFEDAGTHPRSRVVYYEALCAAPQETTRELFRFTALDWSEQTAAFLKSSTTRSRAGYYSVFKDPLESAWHWTGELAESDAARVAEVTADSLVAGPYFVASSWNRPAAGFTDRG
jgi:hypothetical protein